MKAIGGYFELELNDFGTVYHDNLVALNSGRNAFEYILIQKKYKKIYIPYYTCDVTLQPLKRQNIDYEFYYIDKEFFPIGVKPQKREALLYVNYFGLMNKQVKLLTKKYENLIIDNSQAFFEKPIKGIDTFYSPRKFFGLPDGGFAFTNKKIKIDLEPDYSFERIIHLIGRIEKDAETYYNLFKENEKKLDNLPIRKMSNFTQRLMKNINFEETRQKRNKNFSFLHNALRKLNELSHIIDNEIIDGPMVYPLLIKEGKKLKKYLTKNKIFVPTYWPNVYKMVNKNDWEYYLTDNLIPLPIDQRYSTFDMEKISSLLLIKS